MGANISGMSGKFSYGNDSFISPSVGGRVKESAAQSRQALTNGDPNTRPLPRNEEKVTPSSARQSYVASSSNSTMRRDVEEKYRNRYIPSSLCNPWQTVAKNVTTEIKANLQNLVKRVKNDDLAVPIAAHTLLEAATLRDMQATLKVYQELDNLLSDKPGAKNPPQLYLYNSVKQMLGGGTPMDFSGARHNYDSKSRHNYDSEYFGKKENIPKQFWNDITEPHAQKLSDAMGSCGNLGLLKSIFTEQAANLKDKCSHENTKSQAFDELNHAIWQGGYPGKKEDVLKNPKKFIAESYNAMSLSLGLVGTHISILKRQIEQHPELQTDEKQDEIQETTDRAYKAAFRAMDEAYDSLKNKTKFDKTQQPQSLDATNVRLAPELRKPVGGSSEQREHLSFPKGDGRLTHAQLSKSPAPSMASLGQTGSAVSEPSGPVGPRQRQVNTQPQGVAAWKPSVQPEFDHRACQRFVERKAADDTELSVCQAIELRRNGLPGTMPDRLRRALPVLKKDDYEQVARRGLHQMSRTAMGVVDVSAAKEKAASMAAVSGEQARQATEASLTRAVDLMYQNRFTVFSTPAELRVFVEELARTVTDGVLKPDHLIRRHDSDKYPYTLVKDLEAAMEQFYVELHARMATGESPRTLAPWIEYRMNLSDHFFADGCGKTSQLMAGFVCMRAEHPFPLYRTSKEYYALNGKTRRGVDEKADAQTLQRVTAYYQKLFMPHDVFESVPPNQVHDALRLFKQRDSRPKVASDSGNTYGLRRQLLAKGPDGLDDVIPSYRAYTYPVSDSQELPIGSSSEQSKALMKAYISDSSNWVPERRRLHERVLTDLRNGAIELHESIEARQKPDAKPLLLMMRGNSGVGKSYFLNNLVNKKLPQLGLPDTQDIGSKVINPDVFKENLRKLLPGEVKWAQEIHSESSMLADQLIAEMRDDKRNFVVDKRLAKVSDAEEITGPGKQSAASHRTVMIDIDAPLNVSLAACESRDDQGSSVRPPRQAILDGFRAIRQFRQQVAESPLLDAYYAFARVANKQGIGDTVEVARRNEGESSVTPVPGRARLWREITSFSPSHGTKIKSPL